MNKFFRFLFCALALFTGHGLSLHADETNELAADGRTLLTVFGWEDIKAQFLVITPEQWEEKDCPDGLDFHYISKDLKLESFVNLYCYGPHQIHKEELSRDLFDLFEALFGIDFHRNTMRYSIDYSEFRDEWTIISFRDNELAKVIIALAYRVESNGVYGSVCILIQGAYEDMKLSSQAAHDLFRRGIVFTN